MVLSRLDTLLDHGVGLARTLESCVQPSFAYRFAVPRNVDLRGRVAVVTGGSSGVAKEMVSELAARGCTVIAGCRRPHLVPSGRFPPPTMFAASGGSGGSGAPKAARAPAPLPAAQILPGNQPQRQEAQGGDDDEGGAPPPTPPLPAAQILPGNEPSTGGGDNGHHDRRPAEHQHQQQDLTAAQGSAAAAVMAGASRVSPAGAVATASDAALPKPDSEAGAVHALHLDLADLDSVEAFAGRVNEAAGGRVDLLVLCAAIAGKPYTRSPQGHELHFAVNFLGHAALTSLLLPALLPARARVVVVSSILHTLVDGASRDWRYPAWPQLASLAGGWWAYCRSNLAKTRFAYELARRHPELTVPVCHPGVIDSGLTQLTLVPTRALRGALEGAKAALLAPPRDGARTPLWCALSDEARSGTFYHNVLGIVPSSKPSYDPVAAAETYDEAQRLVDAHRRSRAAAAATAGGDNGGNGGGRGAAAADGNGQREGARKAAAVMAAAGKGKGEGEGDGGGAA